MELRLFIHCNCLLTHVLQVIDHYENPRNVGKMDPKRVNVGTGLVGAPACGDVMKLQIEVICSLNSYLRVVSHIFCTSG